MPNTRHSCEEQLPFVYDVEDKGKGPDSEEFSYGYGPAIGFCKENPEGEFWVGNDEYASQVNFCPFCGAQAPVQVVDETQLKTAAKWCRELNVSIVDPDGWRYENGTFEFFETPISRGDFDAKVVQCTTKDGFEQRYEDGLRSQFEALS